MTRPEITMQCPVADCGKVANCYDGPTGDIGSAEKLLRDCTRAAVDALVLHIREDHIGHAESCPRSVDRNDWCDCHVWAYDGPSPFVQVHVPLWRRIWRKLSGAA